MDEYRVESGSVYRYDTFYRAYVFCGNLNGRTLEEFIDDRDSMECGGYELGQR